MEILALLTGRGNNTLKNKNILKVGNLPCMQYPCKEAHKVKQIKHFFSSSDDEKILKLGSKLGYQPIKRPKKFSKADSKHFDVIMHALKFLRKKKNIKPEIIVILLANAPIVKSKWISECINLMLKNKKITSVVPVVEENDHHPLRAKKIKDGFLKNYSNSQSKISSNRQDLEKNYFICHNFWVIRTSSVHKNNGFNPWKFMGKKVMPYIIEKSIDIHSHEDIVLANYLVNKLKINIA